MVDSVRVEIVCHSQLLPRDIKVLLDFFQKIAEFPKGRRVPVAHNKAPTEPAGEINTLWPLSAESGTLYASKTQEMRGTHVWGFPFSSYSMMQFASIKQTGIPNGVPVCFACIPNPLKSCLLNLLFQCVELRRGKEFAQSDFQPIAELFDGNDFGIHAFTI